jgi:TatD DNase family protein
MASDAHAHPHNLLAFLPGAEDERRLLGAACAASAWNRAEFEYHEALARAALADGAAPVIPCFAVHPQLAAAGPSSRHLAGESLATLEALAAEGRIRALGETGFDLYNETFRAAEPLQEEIFRRHLEIARASDLPMVLHIRRAMHKVFAYSRELKKLPAVVFHSYSGTLAEGRSLLKRGINAYFSFGSPIILNHKIAMDAAAHLPADRLLLETDAPYQPLLGAPFSRWSDLNAILRGLAALRRAAGSDGGGTADLDEAALDEAALDARIDENFARVFLGGFHR